MFCGANMYFWIGVVENVSDPYKRGRVQVRVLGAHDTYNIPMTESEGSATWYATQSGSSSGTTSASTATGSTTTTSSGSGKAVAGTTGNTVVSTASMSSYYYGSGSNSSGVLSFSGSSTPLDGNMARYSPDISGRVPLWQCYNNPMNLKNGSLLYRRFDDISLSYPANYWQLCRYIDGKTTNENLNTIRKIVSTWAPPSDGNPTEQYIAMVCSLTGISESTTISSSDLRTLAAICRVMTMKECSQNYSVDEILTAFTGTLVPKMTAASSYYDSNGNLRVGSSTAV